MAVLATDPNLQDQNEQDKQPSNSQTTSSQPINVSGTSASGSNANQSGSNSATPAGTSSGRFQNLQNYLQANSGYNQGQGLAGQVGQTLSGKESDQEQAINQESQRVQNQAAQQANPYQQNNLQQYAQQAYSDPNKIASNPNALAQWQQYYQGQYQAPQAYDANGQINQQQQQFQQQKGLAGSESGRMSLLQQLYGTPGYSVGQQNLDNLLLQSQPGQLSQLQQTIGNLSNQLNQSYNTGSTSAQSALDALKSQAASGSKYLQSGLNQDITNEQQSLQQKATDLQNQRQSDYNSALQNLKNRQLTTDQMNALGLTNFGQLYGVDPSQFLNSNIGQAQIGNVATSADQAKFNALAQLSGQPVESAIGQYANPTGTLAPALQYNVSGLRSAVNQSGYDNDYKNTLNSIPYSNALAGMNPAGAIKALQEQAAVNDMNPASGFKDQRAQQITNSINSLQNLLQKYDIDPSTGRSRSVAGSPPPQGGKIR